jgi:hypothetical protein
MSLVYDKLRSGKICIRVSHCHVTVLHPWENNIGRAPLSPSICRPFTDLHWPLKANEEPFFFSIESMVFSLLSVSCFTILLHEATWQSFTLVYNGFMISQNHGNFCCSNNGWDKHVPCPREISSPSAGVLVRALQRTRTNGMEIDGWIKRWMNKKMGVWMDGWWMDEWTDGEIGR